ncbi:MAG TPA: hypothetical protein VK171_07095 [Fimbriimonas sp.]|nr:hypothetical protein [Fimbriimonas sp.]
MTGASDAKSFARASAQHWVGQMAENHIDELRRFTGATNDIELRKKVGDLFVEYMERGMMTNSRIEEIMIAIKMAMKQSYMAIKGTPMEKNVSPEIRRLLDDAMGKKTREPWKASASTRTSIRAGQSQYHANEHRERQKLTQPKLKKEFPIATKYPYIE